MKKIMAFLMALGFLLNFPLFVLKPLDEIAGFVRQPLLQQAIHQLCVQLES